MADSISTHSEDSTLGDLLKIVFAFVFPPLAVFMEVGFGKQFWLNVLLTLLGFVPGLLHAVYIVTTR